MPIYRISGWFKQGLFKQKFTRDVLALSNGQALERVYSEVGSRHRLTRNTIHIEGVTEVKPEDVTDPRVLAMMK
ncbi:MAG: 50S ribosomal protein L18Ae [Methanobacteriota archaeon]